MNKPWMQSKYYSRSRGKFVDIKSMNWKHLLHAAHADPCHSGLWDELERRLRPQQRTISDLLRELADYLEGQ